jgi:hypothetical protein
MHRMSWVVVTLEDGKTHKLSFPFGLSLPGSAGRRYQLQSAIKAGGKGVVFEAMCFGPSGENEGICAVKLLKELSERRQDRFRNEVRILKELMSGDN